MHIFGIHGRGLVRVVRRQRRWLSLAAFVVSVIVEVARACIAAIFIQTSRITMRTPLRVLHVLYQHRWLQKNDNGPFEQTFFHKI